jgi:hypothetical protein
VVCAEFDVAPEEALQDAEGFVRELATHGILLVSDKPLAGPDNSTKGTR